MDETLDNIPLTKTLFFPVQQVFLLKNKTPLLHYPHNKKTRFNVTEIFRFADVFGLDLTAVKTFPDEVPKIPRCAYDDLSGFDADFYNAPAPSMRKSSAPARTTFSSPPNVSLSSSSSLVPMFNQPGSFAKANFLDIIKSRKVRVMHQNRFVQ
jgi:hypothetical protein